MMIPKFFKPAANGKGDLLMNYCGGDWGGTLQDSIAVSPDRQNTLFGLLLFTSVSVFCCTNIMLWDSGVLRGSLPVMLACLAVLMWVYCLSRLTGNGALGLLGAVGALLGAGYWASEWGTRIFIALSAMAFLYFLFHWRIRRDEIKGVFWASCLGALAILIAGPGYGSFDYLQQLHAGELSQDSLFHIAISAMIKNYSIPSTALSGFVPIYYHVLSHRLFAAISVLSGSSVIETYGVVLRVVFSPMIYLYLVWLCAVLDRKAAVSVALMWAVASGLLLTLPRIFGFWAVWDSYFGSESYAVGLSLLLAGMPCLFKKRWGMSDVFIVAVLALLAAQAKISVGAMFFGLIMLRALFLGETSRKELLLCLALSACALGWYVFETMAFMPEGKSEVSFHLFYFLEKYSGWGRYLRKFRAELFENGNIDARYLVMAAAGVLWFFFVHFLFSWLLLARTLRSNRKFLSVFKDPLTLYAVGCAVAGMLIVIFFNIGESAVYYFTNVALFVALPGAVFFFAHLFHDGAAILRGSRLRSAVFAVIMLLIVVVSGNRIVKSLAFQMQLHARIVRQQSDFVNVLERLRDESPILTCFEASEAFMRTNPIKRVSARPFVYPALSERPWLHVIVEEEDANYRYYGYQYYGISPSGRQETPVAPRLLPGMRIVPLD